MPSATPAAARPRSLQQLTRFAEAQSLTPAHLITLLTQEKTEIEEELRDLTSRLNRLGETGANESLIQSVVSAIQERVAHQRKLEEELKLLQSRAFSMATPREQPAEPETEEEQQKKAMEALQIVQRLEPEVVQQVNPIGLKKLIKLCFTVSSKIRYASD